MNAVSKSMVTLMAAALGVTAQIQPVVSSAEGSGAVNWQARTIEAKGIGAPNPDLPEAARRPGAIRAAQMIALRNAIETIRGIYLNSSTTVQNFMTTNDVVSTRIDGFVKGFQQQGREHYMSDGSVEITMSIPLDGIGGIEDMLLAQTVSATPSKTQLVGPAAPKEVVFSGLIIDCRGLKVKPALSPKVIDESGNEIYGSAYVSKDWAIKYGIVGYSKDVNDAAKLERVGDKPGSVKAIKASGDNLTDIVVSNKDAEDIRSAAKNLKFLSECRVIFVVD